MTDSPVASTKLPASFRPRCLAAFLPPRLPRSFYAAEQAGRACVATLMPRRRSIGFIPAATLFVPSDRIALVSTVAVVVPASRHASRYIRHASRNMRYVMRHVTAAGGRAARVPGGAEGAGGSKAHLCRLVACGCGWAGC